MKTMRAHRGFTLVELLVALFAMALLAVMSWRGLDGMSRAQSYTGQRADEVLTLQVGLAQWTADLDALEPLPGLPALEWNGRVLRLTRRSTTSATDGLLVVGWTRRIENGNGTWLRWQSPPVATRGDLQQAWQRADQWSQNPGQDERAREVAITPLDEWQLFFFRENAWTNPQSSDVTTSNIVATGPRNTASAPTGPTSTTQLPDGVRLVLTLPPNQAVNGTLTRDWVNPLVGGKAAPS
jgi:general secretion pathway protein J